MKISEKVAELSGRYKKEGKKFLLDKLEGIGFFIEGGQAVTYIDENGKLVKNNIVRVKEEQT